MVIVELPGASLLVYGDKSGTLWIYHREINKQIFIKEHPGVIDILDYKILPGNQVLLFAVVRYKGVFVYRIKVIENGFKCDEEGTIVETPGYIRFFYPLIVTRPDKTIISSEVWVGLDDGKFLVFENQGLNKEKWELKLQLDLPYVLMGYSLDQDPSTGNCNFFIGNSMGDLFCLEFKEMDQVNFPVSREELEKEKFLTIHGALFEKMIPLSDYRKGAANEDLFYKDFSGCLAISGNNAYCIYFEKAKGKGDPHTCTKVLTDQLLDIKCLPFADFCWTIISNNQKKLHFIKNVNDMSPKRESLEVIFDGEFFSLEFEARIFNLCTTPVLYKEDDYLHLKYRGYLGMGNHTVLPIDIYDSEGKLQEAYKFFCQIVDESGKIGQYEKGNIEYILIIIEEILNNTRIHSSRTAVKLLLLNLMTRQTGVFCKLILSPRFSRVFYKIIDNERTDLIQKTNMFLSRLEKPRPGFQTEINELQTHIKKFILDGASYSEKSENLKELLESDERTGNLIDSIVYRGILYDRQYDPVTHIQFDKEVDGEITRIIPLKPFKNEKFIISTSKGKLFRTDLQSENKKTLVLEYKKSGEELDTILKINNIYHGKENVFIFPSEPVMVVKTISELESSSHVIEVNAQDKCCIRLKDEKSFGTAVCQVPWNPDEKGDECFIGTNQGDIFYIHPPNHRLKKVADGSPDQAAILDLRSFISGDRYFIAAACKNGKVKIYKCFSDNPLKIDFLKDIPVDNNAVTRLFVLFKKEDHFMKYPLLVAGTDSGKCFGIRLVIDQNNNDESFNYIYEWCYRCKEAVKGIYPFTLARGYNYILISSLDYYLHLLEWDGICVDTIRMESPLLQGFMDISREEVKKDSKHTYQNAYATTMDNNLLKIRFFIRERLREEINRCFSGERLGYEKFKEKDPDVLLLKFKTIDIREPHFKKRYYLKSKDFNAPKLLLEEIDQVLGRGKTEADSDTLVALIHRLFSDFFDEILKDEEIYKKLKRIFIKTRDQWGYPGLLANTRAQLYWIRSMLKGCCKSRDPVEMLNHWFKTGTDAAKGSGMLEIGTGEMVKHFITHPIPFIRVKTLQYFQRFIFNPKNRKSPFEKSTFNDALVRNLSQSVFNVLKMYQLEAGVGSPSWFEMEAVRFFTWMVLNYRYTGFCPARFCYDLWESDISSSFLFRLSDAIQISPEEFEKKSEIAEMLHAAGKLMQEMKRENPYLMDILRSLIRFCLSCGKDLDSCYECPHKDNFGREFARFFQSIENLLALSKIDHFKDAPNLKEIPGLTRDYFKGIGIIKEFKTLSRYICQYYQEKSQDIYLLNVIKYSTFYQVKKSLADIRQMIENIKKETSWLENSLYFLVWNRWDDIMKNELDNEVILDFANAIRNYNEVCYSYNEPMDMERIFNNIFTRLNMMAECDSSYLLYVNKKNERIIVIHNDRENESHLSLKDPRLSRIPPVWLKPDTFSVLGDDDIEDRYKNTIYTHMLIKTPGIEPQKTSALYLFFWDKGVTGGLTRIKSHEILGEFIATVAYLQLAMEKQREQKEEFFRIVSHELNQIIRGLLAWMSNLTAGYLEEDPEKRREYYDRFKSSLISADHVIRSLLTFRDSANFELKAYYLDKEIDEVVKNARVQYKDYGNIPFSFSKEPGDYEIITDPTLVGTAVMNLITNARKYNPEKRPVNLRLYIEGYKIIIEVEDRGIGIPKDDYPIVFEPFKRGSLAREYNIDGLGVGLAISKKNIELLGGTIGFESKVKVGTIFKISLNKRKFEKLHLLITRVTVRKAPNFYAVKDIEKRKKILEKLDYNPNKNLLILRGILTEEEYEELKLCYQDDQRTKEINLEALEKLHRESLAKLDQLKNLK